jgi:hypothetical protein
MVLDFGPPMTSILHDPGSAFEDRHNRQSFAFEHRLYRHPLLEPANLVELARRRPDGPGFAYWSNGAVDRAARWEESARRQSLVDTIAGIAQNDSLVLLKRVEQDTVYAPLMGAVLSEVVEACGSRMRDDVIVGRATILLASPGRITAYHMDADCNYLFQVAGDKIIRVFDQRDRQLVSHEAREQFFAGNINSARPDPLWPDAGPSHRLGAGIGVHIPCLAPHWAQVGPTPSVAVSINFDLRSEARVGRIYRMNAILRRRGISPLSPGISPWCDSIKLSIVTAALGIRGLVRRSVIKGETQGWSPARAQSLNRKK